MAKKIYMTNLKGGAGVTTCCVGLGIALANAGERTLIVDGDCDCACALQIGGCANMHVYTLADLKMTKLPSMPLTSLTDCSITYFWTRLQKRSATLQL